MSPWTALAGVVAGAIAGAAGATFCGPEVARHMRPAAKAVLKATLAAMHEAKVRGAEFAEAAEDLYAEAKAEVISETLAAEIAAAEAKARKDQSSPEGSTAHG
jgi:gas vesicle protein